MTLPMESGICTEGINRMGCCILKALALTISGLVILKQSNTSLIMLMEIAEVTHHYYSFLKNQGKAYLTSKNFFSFSGNYGVTLFLV